MAAFGVLAYRAVREDAIHATEVRLRSALGEITTITGLGVVNQREFIQTAAADPAVRRVAIGGSTEPAETDAAAAALRRLQGTAGAKVAVEVLDLNGRTKYALPAGTPPPVRTEGFQIPPAAAIGPMRLEGDALIFETLAPIKDGDVTVGAVRVTRYTARGGANRKIATGLLGPEVVLLSGNSDGTLYSDKGTIAYGSGAVSARRYQRDGERWVSSAVLIRDTPWLYAMELPERVAMAPARALIAPFLLMGAAVAVGGGLLGFAMGRRITDPLMHLTAASEAMARGDRNVTFTGLDRSDEIGRLARAFDTMAITVRGVVTELESTVEARGAQLKTAVERLRKVHEELQRKEGLVTLGRLSGSVGHELRNPLGVMSNVVFMLNTLPDASPRMKEYTALLREQIRLSDRIISDLLDHARSGAPACSSVNVAGLVSDVVQSVNVPASIHVERQVSVPQELWLDREQTTQIIWNLLSNAVQAMASGAGRLTIVAGYQGGRLRVEVQDTGPGVPADARGRLFEPMFTTKPSGVGLGLSISRAFARANGGDLYLAETAGPGACFVLEIPAPTLPPKRADGPPATSATRARA